MFVIELLGDILEIILAIGFFPSDVKHPRLRKIVTITAACFTLLAICTLLYFCIFG